MIVQSLTQYYDAMLKRGAISAPGWGPASISYAICLDLDGNVQRLVNTTCETVVGKKTVLRPQTMTLPAAVKRSSGIAANFLWDNSIYILGAGKDDGDKKKAQRNIKCFEAAAQLHHDILDGVDSPAARAILKFFDKWKPEDAPNAEALQDIFDDVTKGANITFRVDGEFAYEDEQIRAAWQHCQESGGDYAKMQCLVTGREDEIPNVHPAIKGVRDAQSSGAALVSFNAPAFCSYGHEQNMNAPIGKYAAFAYTTALNHLLADKNNVQYIGDMTVVCWAEDADERYQTMGISALFGNAEAHGQTADAVRAVLKNMARGLPSDDLEPSHKFYVLGLAPNAARVSVRFFMQGTFGAFMKNINDHYERLEIVRPGWADDGLLTPWEMLRATVNMKSRDKAPSAVMSGAAMRAILEGGRYPASLLEGVMLRIRAESDVTWQRAAILKAYYLKNEHADCPKEVLTVGLNEASTNPAYTLGRLFAIYEAVQQDANPGINSTIKDKYFNSASAMPASIFPILGNLYQKHLRKLGDGSRIYYDKQVAALKCILGESYPQRMTLAQQGAFDLGYYHQTQKRYEKRNKEEDK